MALTICYDAQWQRLSNAAGGEVFRLSLEASGGDGFVSAELSINRAGETESLLSWPIAAEAAS